MSLPRLAGALPAALFAFAAVAAAQEAEEVVVTSEDLGDGLDMLQQPTGGNVGVAIGPDGVLMVDDQFANLAPLFAAKIEELGGGPARFVINTHYHGDHAGGNEPFAAMGATIAAHDNARTRLMSDQRSPL